MIKTWRNQKLEVDIFSPASSAASGPVDAGVIALDTAVQATLQLHEEKGDTLDLCARATKMFSCGALKDLTVQQRINVFSTWLEQNLIHCSPLPAMVRFALGWPTSCPKVTQIPPSLMAPPERCVQDAWKAAFSLETIRARVDSFSSRGRWHAERKNFAQAAADFGCALVYARQERQNRSVARHTSRSSEETRLFLLALEYLSKQRDDRARLSERHAARRFSKLFKYIEKTTFVDGPFPLLAATVAQRLLVGDREGQIYATEAQSLWAWLGNALDRRVPDETAQWYRSIQSEVDLITLKSPPDFSQQEALLWARAKIEEEDLIERLPDPGKSWIGLSELSIGPSVIGFVRALESGTTTRRSLLLKGGPGVGKSSLVECIFRQACLKNPNLVLIRATVQQFLSGTFSETAQNLSHFLTRLTKLTAPPQKRQILVWIDEIDGIAYSRKLDTSAENSRITTTLFPFLDDSLREKTRNIYFVGTTNCSEIMDPAILSRFSFVSELGMPCAEMRHQLLDHAFAAPHCLAWLRTACPTTRDILTQATDGLTLRDLTQIAAEPFSETAPGITLLRSLCRLQAAKEQRNQFRGLCARKAVSKALLSSSVLSGAYREQRQLAVEHLLTLCSQDLLREALFAFAPSPLREGRMIEHLVKGLEASRCASEPSFVCHASAKPVHLAFPFQQTPFPFAKSDANALKTNDFQIICTPATIILVVHVPKLTCVEQHLFPLASHGELEDGRIDLAEARWAVWRGPPEQAQVLATHDAADARITTFRRPASRPISWFIRIEQKSKGGEDCAQQEDDRDAS